MVFILATTDPQKVPETIHSRCQRFDFRRISTEAMVSRLGAICTAENVEFEGEALELIAHRAEGGMRNALTSLEQLIAFGDGAVTMEVAERMLGAVDSTDLADIVRTIGARDAAACFRWVAEYVETGADMAQFVANLAEHMRNMYVMAVAGPEVVLDVSEATRRELIRGAAAVRRRPPGAASGCFGGCSRRAEDVHEPAAYLRDRADAYGAPRRRCDVGSSGRARGNPGAPAGRRLCRGCRGARVRRRAGGCSCACVCRCSGGGRFGSGCPCWSEPRRGRPWSPLGSSWVSAVRQPVRLARRGATKVCPYGRGCPGGSPCRGDRLLPLPPRRLRHPLRLPRRPLRPLRAPLSPEITAALSNMASLQRLWAGVLASLKKSKAAYGVLFMNTKAVFDAAAGALLIEFPAENDFAFRAVQKPDVQAELAQALRREAHGDIPFELRKGGASAPMASAPAAASAFNAPAPAAQSVPAPSAASSAASASPMSGAPSSVNAPAVPASAAAPASSPAPAPDDDRPPYDDYVPYDDADIPFEDPFACPGRLAPGRSDLPGAERLRKCRFLQLSSEVPPWEDAPQVPAPSGATPQAPASAPAPSPAPSMAAPSASALPPEPDAVSGPSPNPVEEPDLAASLAFGFGDGVNFEEVV